MQLRLPHPLRRRPGRHRYIHPYPGDKINQLLKAADIKVETYWAKYFAKALSGRDISSFFSFGGSGAAASAPAASGPAKSAPAEAKTEDKGKGKKE